MRKRILAVMGVTAMVLGMTMSVGAEEAKADASGKTFAAITTQEDQFNGMLNTGMLRSAYRQCQVVMRQRNVHCLIHIARRR